MATADSTSRPCHIYTLSDPRDGSVRYVGKTVQSVKTRLARHLHDMRHATMCHRVHWLRELDALGLKPLARTLVVVEWAVSAEAEMALIASMRRNGYALTNNTDGGDGSLGFSLSKESRDKIAAAKRGRSSWNKGIKRPYRPSGPMSLEQRAKLSLARRGIPAPNKGKPSPLRGVKRTAEVRKRISEGVKASLAGGRKAPRQQLTEEQRRMRSVRVKAWWDERKRTDKTSSTEA